MKIFGIVPTPSPLSKRLRGILLVVAASLFWGTAGIFIFKIVELGGLSPVGLAFWRNLLSSLILLIAVLIIDPKLLIVKKEDWLWLIGMGVISIGFFHILWNTAVLRLGASLATVIQSNATVIVSILAWILFKEKLSFRKIMAIIAASAGTILAAGMVGQVDIQVDFAGIWESSGPLSHMDPYRSSERNSVECTTH